MIAFTIPGEPVAFARSGGKGAIRFTPKRQRDFMGLVKIAAASAMAGAAPLELTIRATYLVPASWPKKKRLAARWRTSKPDADDAQISSLTVQKVYGPIAGVTVSVARLTEGGAALPVGKIAAILPRLASEHIAGRGFLDAIGDGSE